MLATTNTTPQDIKTAVQVIKSAILQSQMRAVKAINQEQLALYYGIGRYVSMNSRKGFWGKGAIKSISELLRRELPGLRGFSEASLKKMRSFYEEWQMIDGNSFVATNELEVDGSKSLVSTNEIAHTEIEKTQFSLSEDFPVIPFMSIGFTLHYSIISKVKDIKQRKFYIQLAHEQQLKVEDLEQAIANDFYGKQGHLANNFSKTIPDALQAYRAIQMFKDDYLLDFINVEELFVRDKDRDEKYIENEIVHNVKQFIMTFGKDFTFIGNQYELEKFGQEEFPDLLFFNRELAAMVVVELKDGPFKTAYLGQLCGYLKLLDDNLKKPHENPSIGIILCKSANKKFVEYVIQDYDRPMGVATYKTSADMDDRLKELLPPKEELEKLLSANEK